MKIAQGRRKMTRKNCSRQQRECKAAINNKVVTLLSCTVLIFLPLCQRLGISRYSLYASIASLPIARSSFTIAIGCHQ